MKRMLFVVGLGLMTLVLAACSSSAPATTEASIGQVVPVGDGSYIDINAADLAVMMENKDFVLVNVHIPYEGELPNTDVFIPYNQILSNLGQLPNDTNAKIVLYCRSGSMSTAVARVLVAAGYTNVYNLAGGYQAWQAAGYELLNNPPSN